MEIGIKTGRGKIARPEFFLGFGGGAAQGDLISRVRPASYSP